VIVLQPVEHDLRLSLTAFSLATLTLAASFFFDSAVMLWTGILLNCAGIWLLHDGWIKHRASKGQNPGLF
jgi:hypothetical protein